MGMGKQEEVRKTNVIMTCNPKEDERFPHTATKDGRKENGIGIFTCVLGASHLVKQISQNKAITARANGCIIRETL